MTFELNAILSNSIWIGVVICWVRFKKISPAYYPFVFLLTIGAINEIASIIMVKLTNSNAINYNLYSLVEFFLITWQFWRWNQFSKNKALYQLILAVGLTFWITENFVVKNIHSFNSYFVIGASFFIVLMSIHRINQLLYTTDSLLKNASFIICLCFVFYFTYAVLVEAFWAYGFTESASFVTRIYTILIYTNFIVNLVYAFAALWIPTKPKFILPS